MIEPRQIAQNETSCSLEACLNQRVEAPDVRLVLTHHRAGGRRRLVLAGDRRDDVRDVLAHPEALVADPVALHEVVGPARAREDQPREDRGDGDLVARDLAEVRGRVGQVGPGRGLDRREDGDDQEDDRQPDLEELRFLERLVDDGRSGQRDPDREQQDDREDVGVAAHEVSEDRGSRGAPSRPHVGHDREDAEEDAPGLPEAREAGHGGLAGRQRVALDLHVEEVLERDADDGCPQEAQADVGRDVGPEDVLARADADPGEDDARPEDLAERQRLRHVRVLHRRQVVARRLRCVALHPFGGRLALAFRRYCLRHIHPPLPRSVPAVWDRLVLQGCPGRGSANARRARRCARNRK